MPDQSIPDGSVVITPTEMFKELRDTHDEVKALGPRLDALTATVDNRISDHENRIRSLEKGRWYYAGGVAVLATAVSLAAPLLVK